jgi:poly(beta-D-mannuronate) lyase
MTSHNKSIIGTNNLIFVVVFTLIFTSCSGSNSALENNVPSVIDTPTSGEIIKHPADVFDLGYWNITLPTDTNNDGRADSVSVAAIANYTHDDFFYLNGDQQLVFVAPNVANTTTNSSNVRSELRQMLRGTNTSIGSSSPNNNFALSTHENAASFADIGGKMEATLRVDHVALHSIYTDKFPVYSVVIGQIHAGNDDDNSNGFGWGNEPLKIFYKKYPSQEKGSVFWTYERNLTQADPDRTDIVYPVWGNTWDNPSNPGDQGISLGEEFSYEVNVFEDTLYLSFSAQNHETVEYQINLADNVDAYGNIDDKDFAQGYAGDWHYFKAGAYNQCNGGTDESFWSTACEGTGDWSADFDAGDYTQVTFLRLVLSKGEKP